MRTVKQQHSHKLPEEAFGRLVNNVAEALYSITFVDSVRMNFISSKAKSLTGYASEEILTDDT